jgi:orotidine-5'-phosphate decarboxylase
MKQQAGAGMLAVTPGIRPLGADTQDQSRVLTPSAALEAGSDYLVVGRPITQAADPAQACFELYQSLNLH